MNTLDLAILCIALLAAMAGSRLGLVRHMAAWLGIFLGVALGVSLQAAVADRSTKYGEGVQIIAPIATLLLCVFVGGILLNFTARALRSPQASKKNRILAIDRTLGAFAGVAVVVSLVWCLTPVITATRYWPNEISSGSSILKRINSHGPALPSTLKEAAKTYRDEYLVSPSPQRDSPNTKHEIFGFPPAPPSLSPSIASAVKAATVRIEGRACSVIQEGTGVVLARNLIVTNAHVVAGERGTTSISAGNMRRRAELVGFDSKRDIAVLRVSNLGITPLRIASPKTGARVAVFGYPGGHDLREVGGRIQTQISVDGSDLYGEGKWSREILVLNADLAPGDSGGPIVSKSGDFVGLSFAIDPGRAHTSYALNPSEVETVLSGVKRSPVDAGKCLGK